MENLPKISERFGLFRRSVDRFFGERGQCDVMETYGSGPDRLSAYAEAMEYILANIEGKGVREVVIRKRRIKRRGIIYVCELKADLYKSTKF